MTVKSLSPQPGTHRRRELPWLQIVRFHKEIVTRAEEGFFALNGKDDQSDRWSSLQTFTPSRLAGPWVIPVEALQSKPFRLALEQGQAESLLLGGPGYMKWSKGANNTSDPQWCPILYREVACLNVSGGLELTPVQGKWNLSPLVLSQFTRFELDPDCQLEELASQLIEAATSRANSTGRAMHEAILEVMASKFPALEAELSKNCPNTNIFKILPTPWMLFKPTQQFSALTRYLLKDYEQLEANLARDREGLGGLRLLEDPQPGDPPESSELLPLVPLNRVQKEAVQRILDQQPLTVISGPPGTGKSQIVVSLLLNAWAQGKSVLFASNNNKAVDVVRERVEKFESQFPIAVRAGARNRQNIADVLRRTLNIAGAKDADAAGDGTTASTARGKLLEEKQKLQVNLDSHIPQRIGEARKAALTAYSAFHGKSQERDEKIAQLIEEQKQLGFPGLTASTLGNRFHETKEWLDSIDKAKAQAEEDSRLCAEMRSKQGEAEQGRNLQARKVGLDPDQAGDWLWLVNGPNPAQGMDWEQRYRSFITSNLDPILEAITWDAAFDDWGSEETAIAYGEQARAVIEAIERLRADSFPKAKKLDQLDATHAACKQKLLALGLMESVQPPMDAVTSWSCHFGEWLTLEEGRLDFLPWSRRARLGRALNSDFHSIRPHLPLEVLADLGPLSQDLHQRLRPILSCLVEWGGLCGELEGARPLRENLEHELGHLRHRCSLLKVGPAPHGFEPEAWASIASQLGRQWRVSEQAAHAWRRRCEKEATEQAISCIAQEWLHFAGGIPIREAWRKGRGKGFETSLQQLADFPGSETLGLARKYLYSGELTELLEAWSMTRAHQLTVMDLHRRQGEIPTLADRVQGWRALQPQDSMVRVPATLGGWPSLEGGQTFLDQVLDWISRWSHFHEVDLPILQRELTRELNWATENLHIAIDLLPETQGKAEAVRMAEGILESPDKDWPTEDLNHVFTVFSAERIRGRVEQIDAELERTSFHEAKERWRSRLKVDTEAIQAVDALEKSLQRRPEVAPADYGLFRRALRLVPIWITTAQAAQAIPMLPELFDIVVIDEASQCTLTNLLPLMYRGRSLTVIGDDNQLPAIPTIREAEELILARKHDVEPYLNVIGHAKNNVYNTATEALPRRRADVIMLEEHFRSHPQIIGFSNRYIYNQRLELKKDPQLQNRLPVGSGIHPVQVAGSARRRGRNGSWFNEQEGREVLSVVNTLRASGDRSIEIGIVTPFRGQKEWLREELDKIGQASEILVDTANGFQGDERDVIIFSPVVARGIDESAARWVESPPNLINVALTRAREVLYVVADLDYCRMQKGTLHKLAVYCKEIQVLRDTSPAELELFSWLVLKGWEPQVHPRVGDLEVDFILKSAMGRRLVLEVDGREFHQNTQVQDKSRDTYLLGQGYKVLRFGGREVMETPFDVLNRIDEAISSDI